MSIENHLRAKKIFSRTLKGANFMTPIPVKYGFHNEFVYEIATSRNYPDLPGSQFMKGRHGLTILENNFDGTYTHRHDLSQLLDSFQECMTALSDL